MCLDDATATAACNTESASDEDGEFEVIEYTDDPGKCSLTIRLDEETGTRASVIVADCPEAALLQSRAIYRKVE